MARQKPTIKILRQRVGSLLNSNRAFNRKIYGRRSGDYNHLREAKDLYMVRDWIDEIIKSQRRGGQRPLMDDFNHGQNRLHKSGLPANFQPQVKKRIEEAPLLDSDSII